MWLGSKQELPLRARSLGEGHIRHKALLAWNQRHLLACLSWSEPTKWKCQLKRNEWHIENTNQVHLGQAFEMQPVRNDWSLSLLAGHRRSVGNQVTSSLSISRTNCADATPNKFSRISEEVSRVKEIRMSMVWQKNWGIFFRVGSYQISAFCLQSLRRLWEKGWTVLAGGWISPPVYDVRRDGSRTKAVVLSFFTPEESELPCV